MLKKVRIKKFLSCEDTEFDLDQITVLIGRNAAGKTNALKMIQWIVQYAVGNTTISQFLDTGEPDSECAIEFLINENYFKYEIEIARSYTNNSAITQKISQKLLLCQNNYWKTIAEKYNKSISFYGHNDEVINFEVNTGTPLITAILSLLPLEKITPYINQVVSYLSKITYYDLNTEEKNMFIFPESKYIADLSNELEKSVTIKLLHLWNEDKEILEELKNIAGENGLGLINDINITKLELDKNNILYSVFFLIGGKHIVYDALSFGTQRVLSILLALLYDKSNTLLIEQPEDGIHLGLLRKVLSICLTYAKAYNKQLIITTHSPEVIDIFQPENIRLVKMTEHGTKVSKLDDKLLELIPEYLENEGTLSEFIESMDDE